MCNEVKQEMIVWACSETNNKAFDESVVLVNRDEECPYRQASFDYLEKHKLTNMKIVEIDMLDSFFNTLGCEESVAIIPKKMLKIDRNIKQCLTEELSPVKLYSYQLNGSSVDFKI